MCKHARVRPYTCKICGWTSSYHGNMWKHVETHRRELGDAMPEEPVSVISTEGHLVAAPLKAPTLKKRGGGGSTSPSSASKSPKLRIKRSSRPRYEEMQVTVETHQVHDDSMKEGVVIQVKRVSCAIGTHCFITLHYLFNFLEIHSDATTICLFVSLLSPQIINI